MALVRIITKKKKTQEGGSGRKFTVKGMELRRSKSIGGSVVGGAISAEIVGMLSIWGEMRGKLEGSMDIEMMLGCERRAGDGIDDDDIDGELWEGDGEESACCKVINIG